MLILGPFVAPEHLRRDAHLGQRVSLGGDGVAVDEQHRGKRHRLADRRADLVDLDDVADRNLLLLAATAHDRVHRELTFFRRTEK
jgi:hypothetical protein